MIDFIKDYSNHNYTYNHNSSSTQVESMQDKTKVRRPNTLYQECKFADKEEQRNAKKVVAPIDEECLEAGTGW